MYDSIVLEEGGYIVEFSNGGGLPKENPTPVNHSGIVIKCRHPECERTTRSMFGLCPIHSTIKISHVCDWIGRIIPPGLSREQCSTDALPHFKITETLVKWMREDFPTRSKIMDGFIDDVLESIAMKIPDATTLQSNIDGVYRSKGIISSDDIVELTKQLVEKHFPKDGYGNIRLDGDTYMKNGEIRSLKDVPLRIMVASLVLAFACEEANRGDAWFYSFHSLNLNQSRRASVYMSVVYYLLRRYTNASEKQARMSLRA